MTNPTEDGIAGEPLATLAWQPIDTAPKDGTRFLGVDADTLYWPYVFHFAWNGERGPVWSAMDEYHTQHLTHWMPLPPPPSEAKRSGSPNPTEERGGE